MDYPTLNQMCRANEIQRTVIVEQNRTIAELKSRNTKLGAQAWKFFMQKRLFEGVIRALLMARRH